ncbi:MAG: ribosome maturation factor RimP [Caldimonas sp.]
MPVIARKDTIPFFPDSVKWADLPAHFFWLIALQSFLDTRISSEPQAPLVLAMSQHADIETTVRGLGYDLVDVERAPGGLLRVTIDHPATGGAERFITVDDCEKVTRQLQHVLEVEGTAYERLEVSSPGLDRPLKTAADFARFTGEQVELTLKMPFKGRKRFRGELLAHGDGWRMVLAPTAPAAAAKRHAASRSATARAAAAGKIAGPVADEVKVLDFSLNEVREARLVPVIDFKGRRSAPEGAAAHDAGAQDEMDGGRIQ